MKEEAEDPFPTTGHILFLVEAYKYKYNWFEVLDCVPWLLLAAIIGIRVGGCCGRRTSHGHSRQSRIRCNFYKTRTKGTPSPMWFSVRFPLDPLVLTILLCL